jgi:hypothetical protein
MTRQIKIFDVEKKIRYELSKILESQNSRHLILEQVNTSHCKGQKFLSKISDDEYNKIPKDKNGFIRFCKYKTPGGDIYIKSDAKFFESKGVSSGQFDTWVKQRNIINPKSVEKFKNDVSFFLSSGSLQGFEVDGVRYNATLIWSAYDPPQLDYFTYEDSNGNYYNSPVFSKQVVKTNVNNAITNLKTVYDNLVSEKEYWDNALEKKEFLKILDDYGNVREDSNATDEEIAEAKKIFKVYQKKEASSVSNLMNTLIENALSVLPEFTYYEFVDGKPKKLSSPPQTWGDNYGGLYSTTPPDTIIENQTGSELSVIREGFGDTANMMYGTQNFEYRKYYSPIELRDMFINRLENVNIESQIYKNRNKNELYNNEILRRVFTKEAIERALKECSLDATYNFLLSVIDGTYRNPNGRVVGRYYIVNGEKQLEYYIPKYGDVSKDKMDLPCEDKFWTKYGMAIQMLLGLAAGVLYPVGGITFWAALFLDVGVNAYSLTKSQQAQDPDRAKVDLAYLLLPFLVETQAFRSLITNKIKFGIGYRYTAEQLANELKQLKKPYSVKDLEDFFKTRTDDELKLLKYMSENKEFAEVWKAAGKEIEQTLKSLNVKTRSKLPFVRRTIEPIASIVVYGLPSAIHIFDTYIQIIQQKIGRPLSEEESNFWEYVLTHMDEKNREKLKTLSEEKIKELVDAAEKEAKKQAQIILLAKKEEQLTQQEKQQVEDISKLQLRCQTILGDFVDLAKKYGLDIDCMNPDGEIVKYIEDYEKTIEQESISNQ